VTVLMLWDGGGVVSRLTTLGMFSALPKLIIIILASIFLIVRKNNN